MFAEVGRVIEREEQPDHSITQGYLVRSIQSVIAFHSLRQTAAAYVAEIGNLV